MRIKRVTFLLIVMLLLAVPISTAFAASPFDTTVGQNETVNNDVIVFDGDLMLEEGSVVNGDVIVFNGDVETSGTINGDLVIFNGDLNAAGAASVNGDCVLLNGSVEDGSAGGISCTNIEGSAISGWIKGIPPIAADPKAVPDVPDVPAVPDPPAVSEIPSVPDLPETADIAPHTRGSNAGVDFLGVISSTLLLGLLAFAAGSVFPNHLQQVKATARKKPFASGVVGVLTSIAVPALAALLAVVSAVLTLICIGLLGFPIVLLMLLGLAAGAVFGWIAIGTWVGDKLFRNGKRSLAMKAALGTMILTAGLGLLGMMLPFVEGIIAFVAGAIGLGAVALTQFGRKQYPPLGETITYSEDPIKVANVLETLPVTEDEPPLKG
jgi:hypothetical protein